MPMAEPVTATTGKNWAAIILGAVIAIIGLVLAIGGVWLAALGGSLYYVITGVAMMIAGRSEEHTSEVQSLMRISYAVFCLKKKKKTHNIITQKKTHPTITNQKSSIQSQL